MPERLDTSSSNMDALEGQSAQNAVREMTSTSKHQSNPVHHHKRYATVYDAVAGTHKCIFYISFSALIRKTGRVTTTGFLVASRINTPAAPEDVLFRRIKAPPRYEEADPYFSSIPSEAASIPPSDMLSALHAYISDFYNGSFRREESRADWRSMDETALIAFGILLEELAADKLGATGDLVFTEADDSTNQQPRNIAGKGYIVTSGQPDTRKKGVKRRKLNETARME